MQVVILAGGTGTRLKEMTDFVPKAMIPISGKPIIYHIMNHYAKYGHGDFVVALGYKQDVFKNYFSSFNIINCDIEIRPELLGGHLTITRTPPKAWRFILCDTGEKTLKGGRLKKVQKYIKDDTFMLTYGDALCDIDINKLIKFHKSHDKIVTITGISPQPRFGELFHKNGKVIAFKEKQNNGALVNGGFMVLNKKVFDYLDENCDFEVGPLEQIAKDGELMVYEHNGWWACCDTLNDLIKLQKEWNELNDQS